jgi:transposase-like protein
MGILLVLFFPLGVWLARNGAKASEASRSAVERQPSGRRSGLNLAAAFRGGCQAEATDYTAEYKQRILEEAEAAAVTRGGLGALLRREGLYSSLLAYWRRERAQGILEALTPQKRGPKSKRDPIEEEVQKLRRQNARLSEDLRKAHIIIDVQKKWRRCWITRFRIKTQRRNPDDRGHHVGGGRGQQRCLPCSWYTSRFLLPGSP